jgi:hypothetical protein
MYLHSKDAATHLYRVLQMLKRTEAGSFFDLSYRRFKRRTISVAAKAVITVQ